MSRVTGNTGVVKLGKLLQRIRESIGMSREELAHAIGSTYEGIRLYEEGKRIMKIDRFFELVDALGIPVGNYLPSDGDIGSEKQEALRLMTKASALNKDARRRLIRQVNALIEIEKEGWQ